MLVSLGTALCANASSAPTDPLVFGLTETNPSVYATLTAGQGIGQAVTVGENLTINDFGFYLEPVPAATVDFFIYDETTSTVVLAPVGVTGKAWEYLDDLDVNLYGGQTYYFGVVDIAGTLDVGSDPADHFFSDDLGIPGGFPPVSISSLDFTGNATSVAPTTTNGSADIALRIYSTEDLAPEPNSLILLGTGILAGAATLRRKFVR
jgi:hypothetical protein